MKNGKRHGSLNLFFRKKRKWIFRKEKKWIFRRTENILFAKSNQDAGWKSEEIPIMKADSTIFRIPPPWRWFPECIFVRLIVVSIFAQLRGERVFIWRIVWMDTGVVSCFPMSMWESEQEFFPKMRRGWAIPIFAW